ncbi:MAG: hypothetical protein UW35_C0035G0008 [Candidatus Collierbacteria bacterium GW2011_GWF2_44_15]|uniref:Integral membrane protein n=4 Tax=Patescibacteria group TaxID=1783273 RepID=A0A0G1HGC0_9BACT|nr:MAG: hypothetical protein UR19_C0009G0008 [Candidatus Nomurabacteria bacterium GW2011_GWF1_31_48]KKT34763.1 MAG: hypothetical protein UW23_C0029G0006 [Candidatus Collierbacteria bacterium GW2011_GWA1_44_12]KKT45563.1 MAG: hypothetical protein UW35_C0035G0008 [Candidatus Collierbacteria bacterium GW2011_GWF2_44_15]KKU30192.1 MAG: hypothetical protein UX41_C0008G0007 [Candidatus Collierbacteria bacterium GW2011_GWE1_46_18]
MTNILDLIIKPVLAQGFVGDIVLPSGIPSDVTNTVPFLSGIVRFIVIVGGLFTLWQFLLGGFGMISGGGDKAKVADAQHKITNAITGLVVMTASFIIIGLVSRLLFGSFTAILVPELQTVE